MTRQEYRELQRRERNRRDRLVWRAATRLHREHRLRLRTLMDETGLCKVSVHHSLHRLAALGYLRRGPKCSGGTWTVVLPLIEVAS